MIKLIKSTFYNEKATKKALTQFIRKADKLSIGEQCLMFEKNFARYQNRKYCVFVNSGSSANLAIIQALINLGRLKRNDKVGFSALTWSTNVMPLIQLGLEPVPIDIEIDTVNMSSKNLLETLNTTNLKAVFITNLLGYCDDIDEIARICKKRKILLIEDTCEALGTEYKGKKLGNYGMASTFSFYVGHHMSTIEGGAIVTDDEELYVMLNLVRAHGWDRNLTEDKQLMMRVHHNVNSTFYSRYTFYDLGYNLRTTEINGFIGNLQLKYLDEIIKKREDNYLYLAKYIYKNNAYIPMKHEHLDVVSNFAVPVVCKTQDKRKEMVKKCKDKIEIRPIVGGDMTAQPFFAKYVKPNKKKLPNARLVHEQGFYFGNNPELTMNEKRTIVRLLN